MKKIYNSFFITLAVFFTGCLDLEEKPVDILAPEVVFNTEADVEAAVMGCYSIMASNSYLGQAFQFLTEWPSDLSSYHTMSGNVNRNELNRLMVTSTNNVVSPVWINIYAAISAANLSITGASKVDMDEIKKNQLLAEARLIRAYNYYHLVQLWGDAPYLEDFVSDPKSVKTMSRTPAAEIWDYIKADCEFAKQNLPNTYPNDIRSRPTKGTAYTLAASVYLTTGEWPKAAADAVFVIEHAADFGYILLPDYQDVFKVELMDNKEQIWTVDFKANIMGGIWPQNVDYITPSSAPRGSTYNGWSLITPPKAFFNGFDGNDYRKEVTFLIVDRAGVPYTSWSSPTPHYAKLCRFPGPNRIPSVDFDDSDLNVTLFRFAEVYLIAAEALNEVNNGPSAKAYEYINAVRARARNGAAGSGGSAVPANLSTGMSKAVFLQAVLDERKWELCFEMKRWYDIKRRNLGSTVFSTTGYDTFANGNFTEADYLMPIPQTEVDKNENLTQNPGY